ncbi:MAG: hypothetical protein GF317_23680, partial [Candidatus Lokiarchaeota archaeon]|nr:hypothetical protein [Candidatus Lokiarchaeota archaeon]MBD3202373.1 hypothetical protein [Candidatus Lokiarchaeota archaeon]
MVNLDWEGKNTRFQKSKKKYLDCNFQVIKKFHSNNSNKINQFSNKACNELFWGDNSQVINYLLKESNKRIDLIYLDPPFFSGSDYSLTIKSKNNEKTQVAYKDNWNKNFDEYLEMIYQRLILMKEILASTGLIFVHLDWHASHYIKVIMDEIFGKNNFINNIVWYYYNKYSASKTNLPRAHDDILVYSKSKNYTFNELRIPRDKPKKQLKRKMVNGVLKNAKDKEGKVIYRIVKDKKMDDVWKIPCMQPASKQWTGYP